LVPAATVRSRDGVNRATGLAATVSHGHQQDGMAAHQALAPAGRHGQHEGWLARDVVRITDGPYEDLTGKRLTVDDYVNWPPLVQVDLDPFEFSLSDVGSALNVWKSIQIDDGGVVTLVPKFAGVRSGSFRGKLDPHTGLVSVDGGSVHMYPGYTLAGARGPHCNGVYDIVTGQEGNEPLVFKKRGESHVHLAWDENAGKWAVTGKEWTSVCYAQSSRQQARPESAGPWMEWDGGRFVENEKITFTRADDPGPGESVLLDAGPYFHLQGRVVGLPIEPVAIDNFKCRIAKTSSVWGAHNGQWHNVVVIEAERTQKDGNDEATVHLADRVQYVPQEFLEAM